MAEDNDNGAADSGRTTRGTFARGNRIATGRRGSRNKLGQKFIDALLAEWRRSGKKALQRAAGDDPVAFCKMIANLLPKEIAQSLSVDLNQQMRLSIEVATFSQAYDAWGAYLGAQPPLKLIEAQSNGHSTDEPDTN